MKLICYLCNGYPSIENSVEMAKLYADAGCDIIEIDFPSRDPYLESDLIKGRMAKALEACDDFDAYMQGMIRTKNNLPNTKFILMVYENVIDEIGYDKFLRFCLDNDFKDMILVGIKDDVIKNKLIADGVRVSCYVQYDLQDEEVAYAKQSNGFVYLQAKPKPGQIRPGYPELKDCIRYLREQGIENPIYCGVGIHAPEDAAMAKEAGADAVFVGSTILKLHDQPDQLAAKIKEFKAKC